MGLTAARDTKQWGAIKAVLDDLELGQKTNTKIYQGALTAIDSTGYLVPGAVATTLIAAGVAFLNPNTGVSDTTGVANGVTVIRVRQGVFRFLGESGNSPAITDVGKYCYIVDDQTVSKSSNGSTRSKAGIIISVDSAGVWVAVGLQLNPAPTAAAT